MQAKIVAAARFKAECLRLIDEMTQDRRPVTITKRGRPVATLQPIAAATSVSIIGALRGSILRYDEPFEPAADAADWNANR